MIPSFESPDLKKDPAVQKASHYKSIVVFIASDIIIF